MSRALDLRISRRALIGSGAAASLFAASGLGAEPAAQAGGALRIAVPDGDMFRRLIAPGAVFDCLCEVDADGALRGELAEVWQSKEAGRVWTLRLRRGAVFHDGAPVRAADLTKSLRRHAKADGVLRNVRSLRRSGTGQVTFTLHGADPQFPMVLADPALVIRRGGAAGDVGTGAYRVAERGPGARLKLERVPDHPKAARAGRFARIEILRLEDAGDRLVALTSGRVDAAFGLPLAEAREASRLRRLRLTRFNGPDGAPVIAGHVARLRGLDGRDPFRIAERGFFA